MAQSYLKDIATKVQIDRVMERIGLLAEMARDSTGGVTRLAFSPQEADATQLLANWMEKAGLTITFDAIGNMFGSTDGNASNVGTVGAGSHLDTVPNGGAFDGVLGAVGALEAIEAMKAAGYRPKTPLEIVVWRCEEAALFGQGRLGSLYYTGELSLETIRSWEKPDLPLSRYLEQAAGLLQREPSRFLRSYLELHIEQGRRLEISNTPIGVVTAIPGATRWQINISGRADHSGATPMGHRRDALCAAAELVLAVEKVGMEERGNETVATATSIRTLPGAWNVVPGWAQILTDIRGIDQASIDRTLESIRKISGEIAVRRQVGITVEEVTRGKPVQLDEQIVGQIESVALTLGHPAIRMPSGAGHDAQTIAPYSPTGMIFVPSIDGISHAPEENTKPEDIEAGVQVLAATWALLAG